MADIIIDVVGTERYWDINTISHMRDVENYCEDLWESHIEENGDYGAAFISNSKNTYYIPESALEGSSDTTERRVKANNYNSSNFQYWYESHVVLVLDWSSEHDVLGQAGIGSAGTSNKSCIVNVEGFNSVTPFYDETMEQGTALHEVLHTVNAYHEDGVVFNDDTTSLIVTQADPGECSNLGSPETRVDWISSCCRNISRNYIRDDL